MVSTFRGGFAFASAGRMTLRATMLSLLFAALIPACGDDTMTNAIDMATGDMNACPSTAPAPGSQCANEGAQCSWEQPTRVACACSNLRWQCGGPPVDMAGHD